MAIRIQLRKDHPNVWDSADPTLAAGEFGFAWDSADSASFGRLKIGDGSTSWTNLPYFYSAGDSAGNYASAGGASATWYGDRGLYFSGFTSAGSNTIDYITIATPGNATDFGDNTVTTMYCRALSNGSRAVNAGGYIPSTAASTNVMSYVETALTGNATDFGDLSLARERFGACSNGTRGLFAGGYAQGGGVTPGNRDTIDYITVATTGNATDFGNLTSTTTGTSGVADATYGVFALGNTGSYVNTIEYVTIDTTGNSADFGDATVAKGSRAACSDTTRGIFAGGDSGAASTYVNVIDYITIATTGNATDFGDLTDDVWDAAAVSDATYGVIALGYTDSNVVSNVLNTINIQTTGNATDFGDLTEARRNLGCASGSPS